MASTETKVERLMLGKCPNCGLALKINSQAKATCNGCGWRTEDGLDKPKRSRAPIQVD